MSRSDGHVSTIPPAKLRGVLAEIRYQGDGFLIGVLADGAVVKGPVFDPKVGMEYTFLGRWDEDSRYGRQFVFSTAQGALPSNLEGVRRYLGEHAPWVGPEISRRLIKSYGSDALAICKEDPERVAREIGGITPERAQEIAATLRKHEAEEKLEIALLDLLLPAGVNRRVVGLLNAAFGDKAPEEIRRDPYGLVDAIRGVGFQSADRIAARVGVPSESRTRVRAGILHILVTAAREEGHTCLPHGSVVMGAVKLLGLEDFRIEDGIESLLADDKIVSYRSRLALASLHVDEIAVEMRLSLLMNRALPDGQPQCEGLADDQRAALELVVQNPVSVITGAPGTGKTHLVRHILDSFPDADVVLAAPTGKAAKRISDQTGREARTIHRILEARMDGGEFVFARDFDNPIDADVLIVDETSMVDVPLMARLLQAVAESTRLVLVGDHHQLPSVGPGNVLRDVIESGVIPVAELTEIKRQDEGRIVRACHMIKDGRDIEVDNANDSDLFFLERDDPLEIKETVLELVLKRLPVRYGVDSLRDVQVITPLRERTVLSCAALNREFQRRLLPGSDGRLRIGDKVIQTRNDPEREIVNGDIGYVRAITGGMIRVEIDPSSRIIEVPVRDNDLQLAYAVTVHKYQGSEARMVVIPIHRCFGPMMLQRNLLYTAVSRAKELCVLVGQREEIRRAISRVQQHKRHTILRELLL
jgi:exodeoxyribonuclease V alpha subunit